MGDERRVRKLTLLALIGFVAILGLLALSGTIGGEATYEGTSRCNDCHEDQVENWETTMHGTDFSAWNYHDEPTNKYTYGKEENDTSGMPFSCAECHVVGYGETDIGGFDPDLPWNDTYNAGDDGENLHLLRIGCENCHGAGSDHTSSKAPADIDSGLYAFSTSCGPDGQGCHGDGRQWGNETLDGYFSSDHYVNELASARQSAGCSICRSTQGFIAHLEGEDWEEVPAPEDMEVVWRITCLACHDPHPGEGEENSFQLRMEPEEICAECHRTTSSLGTEHVHHPQQEFRTASVVYTADAVTYMGEIECVNCHMFQSGRGTPNEEFKMGHSFAPHMEACMDCHSMYETPEDARAAVDHVQHRFHEVIGPVAERLGIENEDGSFTGLKALKLWAEGNESAAGELWTEALELAYSEAHWDVTMAEADASQGFHNPMLVEDIAKGSMERIVMIEDAMNIGGVAGTVSYIEGDAIAGAVMKDASGAPVATTDADGAYFFWASVTPQAYNLYDGENKLLGTSSFGAIAQTNVTTNIELEKISGGDGDDDDDDDDDGLDTLSYVFIGIIVLLIIILIVVAMMGKKE